MCFRGNISERMTLNPVNPYRMIPFKMSSDCRRINKDHSRGVSVYMRRSQGSHGQPSAGPFPRCVRTGGGRRALTGNPRQDHSRGVSVQEEVAGLSRATLGRYTRSPLSKPRHVPPASQQEDVQYSTPSHQNPGDNQTALPTHHLKV